MLSRLRPLLAPCHLVHIPPCRPPARISTRVYLARRAYPSQSRHPTASSLLSETLDGRQGGPQRSDNVGPFQLGLNQQSFAGQKRPKPWSELSAGGKAVRATARTSNLVVILFGAGITAVLIYALTSELFSSNSPTVLYNDACERIKASPRIARQLPGHIVFHTSPPSSLRPRHRNRSVASQLVRDSAGREHLLLSFYIQALPVAPSTSYLDSVKDRLAAIPTISASDIAAATSSIGERAKSLFRYLTGDSTTPSRPPSSLSGMATQTEHKHEEPSGFFGSITGVFGSLRGSGRSSGSDPNTGAMAGQWQEGEVHVDFVKDDSGSFVYRYLLIDIPNSRTRSPVRLFVERADGVRENEPVMRWDAS